MRAIAYLIVSMLPVFGVAGEQRIPTAIDAVTVYLDRAEVHRVGDVDLSGGAATVLIEDLPATLDPASLAVKAQGAEGLVISSVEVRRVFTEELAQPTEQELHRQMQAATDERAAQLARKAALDTQAKFIDGLAALPGRGEKEQPFLPPMQWPAAWEAIGRGMAQTNEARTKLDHEIRATDQRIERLQKELEQLHTGRKDSVTAVVHLESPRAGRARLVLSYQIEGAGWVPQYDARLDTEQSRVTLQRAAAVQQTTGESWKDVTLTVATGRPSAGAAMPELSTWWVEFDERRPLRHKAMPGLMAEDMAAGVAPAEAWAAEAESVGTDFSAKYRIPGRVSLAADGTLQRFVIGSQQTPVNLEARTTPKLDQRAFVYAEFRLTSDEPLLAGKWRLVRDDMFVGDIEQPTRRPGETLALAFGSDDGIQVDYKPLADEHGDTGLFGSRRKVQRLWQVIVKNGHRTAMPIAGFDQLPVSRDEDLQVQLSDKSTPPSIRNVEGSPGVLAWHLQVAPRSSTTVRFGYEVSYPEGKIVPGF